MHSKTLVGESKEMEKYQNSKWVKRLKIEAEVNEKRIQEIKEMKSCFSKKIDKPTN